MKNKFVYLLLIVWLFLSCKEQIYAQQYSAKLIKHKADSLLIMIIGDSVFQKHCVFDKDSYYTFISKNGKEKYAKLRNQRKTRGRFVNIDYRWKLQIPTLNCPAIDTIKGNSYIFLDSLLQAHNAPYLNFIPEFYWANEDCKLISNKDAIEIAQNQKLQNGIDELQASIKYNHKNKSYYWKIEHTISEIKVSKERLSGTIELLEINAQTGEIEYHKIVPFIENKF